MPKVAGTDSRCMAGRLKDMEDIRSRGMEDIRLRAMAVVTVVDMVAVGTVGHRRVVEWAWEVRRR
jgi:hypothetical protein